MLDYHGGVRNEWPEVVRKDSWIPLEVGKEGRRVSIIVRIYVND